MIGIYGLKIVSRDDLMMVENDLMMVENDLMMVECGFYKDDFRMIKGFIVDLD